MNNYFNIEKIDWLMEYLKNCHYAEVQVYNISDENNRFFSEESVIHMFFKINNSYEEIIDVLKNIKTNQNIGTLKFNSVLDNYIHKLSKFKFDENFNQARINHFLDKYELTDDEFKKWFDEIEFKNPLYKMLSKNICFFDKDKFDINLELDPFLNDVTFLEIQEIQSVFENYIKDIYIKKLIESLKSEKYLSTDNANFLNEIFKKNCAKLIFDEYAENYIEESFKDYSFLFQTLLKENLIYDIKHKKLMKYLYNNSTY